MMQKTVPNKMKTIAKYKSKSMNWNLVYDFCENPLHYFGLSLVALFNNFRIMLLLFFFSLFIRYILVKYIILHDQYSVSILFNLGDF